MITDANNSAFKYSGRVVVYPLLTVLLMWIVFWAEFRFGFNFNQFGVFPRTISGLKGILFSPFIHADLKHLFSNSIPLLVLFGALLYFYRYIALKVFFILYLFSGFGTWLVGRPAYHIGASGLIYALVAFLFFKGVFSKNYRLSALSLLVVFLYGSLVWGIVPLDPKISWEGHLSGFLVGFILSILIKRGVPKTSKYAWEKKDYVAEEDDFMRHFDANGNFIEIELDEDLEKPLE